MIYNSEKGLNIFISDYIVDIHIRSFLRFSTFSLKFYDRLVTLLSCSFASLVVRKLYANISDQKMKDLSCELPGPAPLLAALDAKDQIHLIVGANPLAAARCTKCLDVGAIPIVIAPEGAEIHSTLLQKIEDGRVRRIVREFQDDDLKTLGRDEVDNFVDAVFVTLGRHNPLSKFFS